MKKKYQLIYGEVLFDIFNDKTVIGGAPFNVAWHLQGFGFNPLFISRIGKDKNGHKVISIMKNRGMSTYGIQIDLKHPTGTVSVETKDNSPVFKIMSKQAYDYIQIEELKTILDDIDKPILYHGTLALREDISHNTLKFIKKTTNPTIFFDINLRAPWWDKDTLTEQLEEADYVKVNNEELKNLANLLGYNNISNQNLLNRIIEYFSLKSLIVTCGEHGAFLVEKSGKKYSSDPYPVSNFIDSVGAGDAFSSVIIIGNLLNWNTTYIINRACQFASQICQIRGAITDDPKLYDSFKNKWKI